MQPKEIPELITKFAEAVRADEWAEGTEEDRVHNYREARSNLAVRFHRVLEQLQRAERELDQVSAMVADFDCDTDDRRVEAGWEALRKWGKERRDGSK